jgi:hypothetical protein
MSQMHVSRLLRRSLGRLRLVANSRTAPATPSASAVGPSQTRAAA